MTTSAVAAPATSPTLPPSSMPVIDVGGGSHPQAVTTVLLAPSSFGLLGQIKEYAHNAAAPLGLLMLVAFAITAMLNHFGVGIGVPAEIAYVGGGLLTLSKAIDSYSFTATNVNAAP